MTFEILVSFFMRVQIIHASLHTLHVSAVHTLHVSAVHSSQRSSCKGVSILA